MSNEHAETLNRLFEDGYLIMLQEPGHELDEQVTMIQNLSGNDDEPDWEITTDTRCWPMEDIHKIFLNEVKVYARVDWANIRGEHMPWLSDLPSLQDWNQDLDNAYDEAGD